MAISVFVSIVTLLSPHQTLPFPVGSIWTARRVEPSEMMKVSLLWKLYSHDRIDEERVDPALFEEAYTSQHGTCQFNVQCASSDDSFCDVTTGNCMSEIMANVSVFKEEFLDDENARKILFISLIYNDQNENNKLDPLRYEFLGSVGTLVDLVNTSRFGDTIKEALSLSFDNRLTPKEFMSVLIEGTTGFLQRMLSYILERDPAPQYIYDMIHEIQKLEVERSALDKLVHFDLSNYDFKSDMVRLSFVTEKIMLDYFTEDDNDFMNAINVELFLTKVIDFVPKSFMLRLIERSGFNVHHIDKTTIDDILGMIEREEGNINSIIQLEKKGPNALDQSVKLIENVRLQDDGRMEEVPLPKELELIRTVGYEDKERFKDFLDQVLTHATRNGLSPNQTKALLLSKVSPELSDILKPMSDSGISLKSMMRLASELATNDTISELQHTLDDYNPVNQSPEQIAQFINKVLERVLSDEMLAGVGSDEKRREFRRRVFLRKIKHYLSQHDFDKHQDEIGDWFWNTTLVNETTTTMATILMMTTATTTMTTTPTTTMATILMMTTATTTMTTTPTTTEVLITTTSKIGSRSIYLNGDTDTVVLDPQRNSF